MACHHAEDIASRPTACRIRVIGREIVGVNPKTVAIIVAETPQTARTAIQEGGIVVGHLNDDVLIGPPHGSIRYEISGDVAPVECNQSATKGQRYGTRKQSMSVQSILTS